MNPTFPSPEASGSSQSGGGTVMQTGQHCDECCGRGQQQRGLGEPCRREELTTRDRVSQGGLSGGGSTLQKWKRKMTFHIGRRAMTKEWK